MQNRYVDLSEEYVAAAGRLYVMMNVETAANSEPWRQLYLASMCRTQIKSRGIDNLLCRLTQFTMNIHQGRLIKYIVPLLRKFVGPGTLDEKRELVTWRYH